MSHRHKVKRSEVYAYSGTIPGAIEERRAHGGVRHVDFCACGAKRQTNSNGNFAEVGPWVVDEPIDWLLVRHGSNAANQSRTFRLPVAVVRAVDAGEATETRRDGGWDGPSYSTRAPWVDVWANQRLEAIPLSRATRADVEQARETEADYLRYEAYKRERREGGS